MTGRFEPATEVAEFVEDAEVGEVMLGVARHHVTTEEECGRVGRECTRRPGRGPIDATRR